MRLNIIRAYETLTVDQVQCVLCINSVYPQVGFVIVFTLQMRNGTEWLSQQLKITQLESRAEI